MSFFEEWKKNTRTYHKIGMPCVYKAYPGKTFYVTNASGNFFESGSYSEIRIAKFFAFSIDRVSPRQEVDPMFTHCRFTAACRTFSQEYGLIPQNHYQNAEWAKLSLADIFGT